MAAMSEGFATFETPIGVCGIAWGVRGITGVRLPGMRSWLPATNGTAPPPAEVQRAIDQITRLLSGERVDLRDVRLDMDALVEFDRRVYAAAREVPPGRTTTYGTIAKRLGDPALAREVGQALGRNPFAIVVPCHRVVASNGKLGGFSASGGIRTKQRMLTIEGGLPGFG
jgi:methylated-DNA-[protein]-cysteine S-methyltransferase